MGAVGNVAILILAAIVSVPVSCRAVAQADEAACEATPIAAARKAAQVRRTAGDPAGAWKILEPFTSLACLDDAGKRRKTADRKRSVDRALSDFAWLLNDAYVNGADPRLGFDGPAVNGACIELLRPLADDDLVPHPWMSAALHQASIANIKACAAHCVPPQCAPFNAQVWATYRSEEKQFRTQACAGGGQKLDDGRCLEIRAGKEGFDFSWSGNIKGRSATPDETRALCPALYRHVAGRTDAVRLELPDTSALRDDSNCCSEFKLKVKPGTDEFVISGADVHDCYGGTARRFVEEIYRLAPGADSPVLVRDNSQGVH